MTAQTMLRDGIPLVRVLGIPVNANASLIPIALLVSIGLTVSLGLGVFGFPLAVLGAALLFASILAHELGHAVVAREFGIRTAAITLHFFGGVAKITGEPKRPRHEVLIAVAGPAVSLCLSVAFGVVLFGLGSLGVHPALLQLIGWLAGVNLILAVFNLLPGLPLDGGRVLRAWLWHRTRDFRSATIRAARSGEFIAWGLIGLGALAFLGLVPFGGLMFVLLGFFLRSLARMERRRVEHRNHGWTASPDAWWNRGAAAGGGARAPEGIWFASFERWDAPETTPRGSVRRDDEVSGDVEYVVRFDDGREVVCRRRE